MPVSWLVDRAKSRQASLQRHEQQTSLAEAICSTAGPVVPTGKKSRVCVTACGFSSPVDCRCECFGCNGHVRSPTALFAYCTYLVVQLVVQPRWSPQRLRNNRNGFSFCASAFLKLVLFFAD